MMDSNSVTTSAVGKSDQTDFIKGSALDWSCVALPASYAHNPDVTKVHGFHVEMYERGS